MMGAPARGARPVARPRGAGSALLRRGQRLVQRVRAGARQLGDDRRRRPGARAGLDQPRAARRSPAARSPAPAGGAADHEHDLAARRQRRRSARRARPPSRARPPRGSSSARGRPRPAARGRARRGPPATRRRAAATRTRRRLLGAHHRLQARALARQEADEAPRLRRRARSPRAPRAPRSARAAPRPRARPPTHACTSTSPGSLTSGIPASLTSATTSPACIRSTSLGATRRSSCSS